MATVIGSEMYTILDAKSQLQDLIRLYLPRLFQKREKNKKDGPVK